MFVDAGYLIAGAGDLYLSSSRRVEVSCDYAGLTRELLAFAEQHARATPLRLYWYDAAPHAVPMSDHLEIARLPGVKLRLGRLVAGEQKGVDSLLVRDLMVLARERAIGSAYVFGGDEDLREGVADAQDKGVYVVTLGFAELGRARPSEALVREADEHIELPAERLRRFFSRSALEELGPMLPSKVEALLAQGFSTPHAFGEAFGTTWAAAASREGVRRLMQDRPVIPRALDQQLVIEAERLFGSLKEDEESRRHLRGGFWDGISAAWRATVEG